MNRNRTETVNKSLSCADALSLDDPTLPNGSYDEELPPGLVYCLLSRDKKLGGGYTIEKCAKTLSPSMLKTDGDCPDDCECCKECYPFGYVACSPNIDDDSNKCHCEGL